MFTCDCQSGSSRIICVVSEEAQQAGLAQSVERRTLNPVVEGSSPSFGDHFYF